jgi:hypothetical protein
VTVASPASGANELGFDVVQAGIVSEDSQDISASYLTVSAASLTPAQEHIPFREGVETLLMRLPG